VIGLSIQPQKCVVWSPFNLPLDFNTPSKGIRVLGVPLGTLTFTSSFIKDALQEDAWHVDLLFKMGDVKVAFRILTCCFVQRPSYLLRCTPSSSTFIQSFISFDFSLFQVFGRLLGPRSFDNPKGPLTCKQASLLIIFDGVKLVLTSTITLTTYLGSWALVISVIVVRFMVDQHPSFLKP